MRTQGSLFGKGESWMWKVGGSGLPSVEADGGKLGGRMGGVNRIPKEGAELVSTDPTRVLP